VVSGGGWEGGGGEESCRELYNLTPDYRKEKCFS